MEPPSAAGQVLSTFYACICHGTKRRAHTFGHRRFAHARESTPMKCSQKLASVLFLAYAVLQPQRVFSDAAIQQILTNGPTANRVNIVILSEGYSSADLVRFPDHAQAFLDRLLGTPPFIEYRSYFNAFTISVASAESGSRHPSSNVFPDTYFHSSYDTQGIQYLISI